MWKETIILLGNMKDIKNTCMCLRSKYVIQVDAKIKKSFLQLKIDLKMRTIKKYTFKH